MHGLILEGFKLYSLANYSYQNRLKTQSLHRQRQLSQGRKWLLICFVVAWVFAFVEVFHVRGALVSAGSRDLHYTVVTGDTVWSIAERFSGSRDPRAVTDEIVDINHLSGSADIHPGQVLAVPRG